VDAVRTADRHVQPDETSYGIHGGDVETSLMLHFQPELVAMDKAENFESAVTAPKRNSIFLRHTGTHAFAWIASDINPAGAVGEAALQLLPRARRRPGIRPRAFSS
jgi:creatinine amidohydrolase